MNTSRTVTELAVDETYWMVGDYFNMPKMSVCRLYGDADDPETCGGDQFGNVYVVIEGPDAWEASGYVKKEDLASTEELLAALHAYRPPSAETKMLVTCASDGAVAACSVLGTIHRPQMSVVRDRDLAPPGMMVDRLMLRDEFRQVCKQVRRPGFPVSELFATGADLANGKEFADLKRELAEAFGIPMEIDEWMVR
ncbi:hypothetical protein [Rhizobium leguminosarum]|uniref:hypothetical protein n=1 Tax=Rhizobium leguminosarum TaxID=384 RepID=UPI002E1301F9|nr:hypothetical protein U8Q02_39955 [Rhizobium leguminosarum]